MHTIATVNLGNTSVRWGLWSGGSFSHRGSFRTVELGARRLFPPEATEPAPDALAVASVVPAAEPKLAELLRLEMNLAPVWLGRDLAVPLELDVEEPAAVGADRLAAALAAHRQFGAAVAVDFGTAVTVNAVTAGGVFLGGAILPGPELCLRALDSGTAGVRVSGRIAPTEPPGRSTRAAVNAALTHGLAGAVDRLVEMCLRRLGGNAKLVSTGGGAELFAPLCRCGLTVLPDLALEGLVVAVQEAG
jgi:type III pantothenate kinase